MIKNILFFCTIKLKRASKNGGGKVAVGTRPVSTVSKVLSLTISLDTGILRPNGNPIVSRVRINGVREGATFEDLYDFAYLYSGLVSKSIADITVSENSALGPID